MRVVHLPAAGDVTNQRKNEDGEENQHGAIVPREKIVNAVNNVAYEDKAEHEQARTLSMLGWDKKGSQA